MMTLRKTISRRPWLLAALGFLLLTQIQQAIACDLMMVFPDQDAPHCPQHDSSKQQMDPAKKPCCDFPHAYSTSGPCHSDPGATISPAQSGKLQLDHHPLFIIIGLREFFSYPQSPPLALVQYRESSRPGTQTYLLTQRLRI
jgi:hypothetical protein